MTTWYIWGGLVRWSCFSATTDPPSSSFGRTCGATGGVGGGFVAMNFILASEHSHRSLHVIWWRHGDIQVEDLRTLGRGLFSTAPGRSDQSRTACCNRPHMRQTLVCEILDSRAGNRDTSHSQEGLLQE